MNLYSELDDFGVRIIRRGIVMFMILIVCLTVMVRLVWDSSGPATGVIALVIGIILVVTFVSHTIWLVKRILTIGDSLASREEL